MDECRVSSGSEFEGLHIDSQWEQQHLMREKVEAETKNKKSKTLVKSDTWSLTGKGKH